MPQVFRPDCGMICCSVIRRRVSPRLAFHSRLSSPRVESHCPVLVATDSARAFSFGGSTELLVDCRARFVSPQRGKSRPAHESLLIPPHSGSITPAMVWMYECFAAPKLPIQRHGLRVIQFSGSAVEVLEYHLRMRVGHPALVAEFLWHVEHVVHLHHAIVRVESFKPR